MILSHPDLLSFSILKLVTISRYTRRAFAKGLVEAPVPLIDYKRSKPIIPEDHPLALQEPPSPNSPFSPVSLEFAQPDTVQLLGGLRNIESELQEVCKELEYSLHPDLLLDTDYCGTPFVTPLQRFAQASRFSADTTLPSAVRAFSIDHSLPDLVDNETDYGDFDDMAGLQLAVVGSSNKWDGSQGTGYWRKKSGMKEAIGGQLRSRGGNMQAADQLSVLENQIEPTSGAADWFTRLVEHLRPEIAAASKDEFPSAVLSNELATISLGHLSTDEQHRVALRNSLVKALPLQDIVMAGDYTPSRASGMLVPYARPAVAKLSLEDTEAIEDLRQVLAQLNEKVEPLNLYYGEQLLEVGRLRAAMAEANDLLAKAKSAAPSGSSTAFSEAQIASEAEAGKEGDGAKQPVVPSAEVEKLQQEIAELKIEIGEADEKLMTVEKRCTTLLQNKIQVRHQLKQLQPVQPQRANTELVKAFMHPTLGRLCTAHDCVVLKIFAIMDVVYGIGTALQQVKFSELRQGKGVGVSPDEGVREFSARIRMHVQSSLDIDPQLAHVQFFAGLSDAALSQSAEDVMQKDINRVMDLETATQQVLLQETRQLQTLKLRAANGDTSAAAELKRRASAGSKKGPAKDPKPAADPSPKPPKPQREFNPDPNHPEGKCQLPGHDKGKGHSNKECFKGGNPKHALAAVAAMHPNMLINPYAAAAMVNTLPNAAQNNPYMAAQLQQKTQEVELLRNQLANAFNVSRKGTGPAKTNPIAAGQGCNICGYPNGHASGFCYYEFPEKSPNWAPTSKANPDLIAHWSMRRQQRNLPPLAPRQVPFRQHQPVANLVYPLVPSAPMLPRPAPMMMLPAPSDPVMEGMYYPNTGHQVTLSAVAKLDQDFHPFYYDPPAIAGAAMPRSFLQFPLPPSPATMHQPEGSTAAPHDAPQGDSAAATVSARGEDGENKRYARGREEGTLTQGLVKKLKFVDEHDMQAAVQAPSAPEFEAMLAELEYSQQVPCLDTFVNMSSATGISLQLPDGRWQLPSMVVTDSGATFGVTFEASCKGVGLTYSTCGVSLVLADGSNVRILGITEPVKLVFARGTAYERTILYRFLVLPGEGKHYRWLVAKNALLELGAYVDPAESAFYYRTLPSKDSLKHALPVKCSVMLDQADPADCLHMLQPVVAVMLPSDMPAVETAGLLCI